MTKQLPPNIQRLAQEYVDGQQFTSSSEVVVFALMLFRAYEDRYHHRLGESIQEALKDMDRGDGVMLNNKSDVDIFFDDMIEANLHAQYAE